MNRPRLLFASCHGYLDPSSGAALATRDVLELLVTQGFDCRVLSTGVLDYERPTSLESVLDGLKQPYRRALASLPGGATVEVFDLEASGVRVTLLPTASSRPEQAPREVEAKRFLDLAETIFERFRPQVLLTYGGHTANLALIRRARERRIAVVFHLHNFGYDDRRPFADVQAVLVPSQYSRRFHAQRLGIDCTVLPYPLDPERVVAKDGERRYVTFVNPQPAKGLTVFARIASELNQRRPEIPFLVVEGRGRAEALASAGLDLSNLSNLHRLSNTPDPRAFYGASRVVLVPSLWRESFGRVAAEALANGLPVVASDRGALPEVLGDAGFVLTLPGRCTPTSGIVPTTREMAPWIALIERLWDDREFESTHQERARVEASRWSSDRLGPEYAAFFGGIAQRSAR